MKHPSPSRVCVPLDTIGAIRTEIAKVYREARSAKMVWADATKAAHVLAQIGRLIESGELEKRLEALEKQLDGGM